MNRIFIKVIFSISIAGCFIAFFLFSPLFSISKKEIVYESSVVFPPYIQHLQSEFDKSLGKFVGKNILSTGINQVRNFAEKQNWLSDIHVKKTLPNTLNISARVKNIVASFHAKNNIVYCLFDDGSFLKNVPLALLPDVPVISSDTMFFDSLVRNQLAFMLKEISKKKWVNLNEIDQVFYTEEKGFSFSFLKFNLTIVLGFNNFESKMNRAQKVIDHYGIEYLDEHVIDANFSKKVLVRKGPGS